MNCKSCSKEFNFSNHKPFTLLLCAHTLCLTCTKTKFKSDKRCPVCNEEILSSKPNFAMLDILENAQIQKLISNESGQADDEAQNEKQETNEKFICANHKHLFVKCLNEPDAYWFCDGTHIFGNCKSNLDNNNFNFMCKTRYQCETCEYFNLCEECLNEPKKMPSEYFYSKNHPHRMNKCKRNNGWRCDGKNVYGKCKLNLNEFGVSFGKTRYKCGVCNDFDFCQACFDAPKLKLFKSANHMHKFTEWDVNECEDEDFECRGDDLFGKCKSEANNTTPVLKYKCVECYNFILCKSCLNEPEKEQFKTPYHEHSFEECFKKTNWRCDGRSIFGECKMGLGRNFSNKRPRYKCKICDNFDLCKECLFSEEPLVKHKSLHHNHELIECSIDANGSNQFCDGEYLFGKCKKTSNTTKRFVCTKCNNFELCKDCFDWPETKSYTTPNHHPQTHVFKEFFRITNWRCDGNSIFGKCKLRLHRHADNHARFKCMMCDDFDLCEECLKAPDKNILRDINEDVIDLTSLFDNQNDN